ncbi:MAG: EF-P beta-lysylation protein EpmB [Planctomycetaceae bacterium]
MHATPHAVSLPAPARGRSGADTAPWQRELARAIRDPAELCRVLGLDPALAAAAPAGFPLLAPRPFVARMQHGNPHDPLLRQVLPVADEAIDRPGFTSDPLHEAAALAAPGLVRKYAGRALVLVSGACAVHCRYCFRREFPYADNGATLAGTEAAVEAIAADPTLSEAILSGGDPLMADDQRLAGLVHRLDAIPHLRRLRIHTRLPIVLPERVTDGLVTTLAASRLAVVVVVHANHPAELDDGVAGALRRLAAAPALLLNQAVLLSGVNDALEPLRGLSERLVDIGVVPYYLHLLDRVRGAGHFEVPEARAVELHRQLRDALPGYAVPRLARELPGEPAKVWIA